MSKTFREIHMHGEGFHTLGNNRLIRRGEDGRPVDPRDTEALVEWLDRK